MKSSIDNEITLKERLFLKLYCYAKLPMIAYCRPNIRYLSSKGAQVDISLKRRTKNHFKSMYFGALSVGADFTGGLLVMHIIKKNNSKARLLFKNFEASFLKRANSDVSFLCSDHSVIEDAVLKNLKSGERVNFKIGVRAMTDDGKVADFILTTSIK